VADVFISYSRLDHDEVKPIADRLQSLGYNVRWDKPEGARQAVIDQRERELDAARVVLVVWSENARYSAQVQADAAHALGAGKLLAVKIEAMKPPFPFAEIQAHDLTGAGAWGPLEQALAQSTRGPMGGSAQPGLGLLTVLPAAGAPVLVTIALAATLAAYAGAVSAAVNGVMTPGQMQIALIGMSFVSAVSAALAGFRLFSTLRAG
jgi:hypothetical protein